MNTGRGSASGRVTKATHALKVNGSLISQNEKSRIAAGQIEYQDATVVLKTHVPAGEQAELLSVAKNRDSRRGINDFEAGKLVSVGDAGTVVVDAVKVSYAAGVLADDAAAKTFAQTGIPADLENAEIEISQGNNVIGRIKMSEFAFKGDEPQTRGDQWKALTVPMVLAAGKSTSIKVLRPEGVAGAEAFLAIEMKGLRTYPKRN